MKQDPILPSTHVCAMQAPPKRMIPSLEEIGSPDYMIGEGLIAILLHGLCAFIAFWCMEIPKHDNPFHSTVEIAFEAPVALPVPQDVQNIDQSDLQTPIAEPSIEASEALSQTDSILPIPVPKLQKPVTEKKKIASQILQEKVGQESDKPIASVNTQPVTASKAASSSEQSMSKNLSPTQRCSALTKEYPMAARRRHEQGTVQVSYQLLADGQVKQVDVVESSGFSDLDRAAIQAVQSMKCQAAPGQPVIKTSMPVHFSLNKLK